MNKHKPTFRIPCTKHTSWTPSDTAHCLIVDSTSLFLPNSRSHGLWILKKKKVSVAVVWGGRFFELWKFFTIANLAASSYFRLQFGVRTEYERSFSKCRNNQRNTLAYFVQTDHVILMYYFHYFVTSATFLFFLSGSTYAEGLIDHGAENCVPKAEEMTGGRTEIHRLWRPSHIFIIMRY